MEPKTARITILIDPGKTPSQVVRRLIRDYLALNGVSATAGQGAQQPAQLA
jgi:hypothetical protein